jgi:putative transposase
VERKKIRLDPRRYLGRGRYFVTACCDRRRERFRSAEIAGEIVRGLRTESNRQGFRVGAYCVMPDHVHLLVQGTTDASDLIRFVKAFKQSTGYALAKRGRGKIWQRFFYDHILRATDSTERIAAYIWLNPVRKGLCASPEEYPFSGSFSAAWRPSLVVESWVPPWKVATKGKMAT